MSEATDWLEAKKMPLLYTLDAIQRHAKEQGALQEYGYWRSIFEGFELCYKPGFWMVSYISWPSPAFLDGKPNVLIALEQEPFGHFAIFSNTTLEYYSNILWPFEQMLTKLFEKYHGGLI